MTTPTPSCLTCADLHCREVQRRSCDLKTAGCGEWEEDRTGEIIEEIKGIVQVLDPKGYAWAQVERERRRNEVSRRGMQGR